MQRINKNLQIFNFSIVVMLREYDYVFLIQTSVENNATNFELENDGPLVPLLELPGPPDGGWGWVICFASFMCNFIVDGIVYR